jgi:hypothetical protein
MYNKHLRNFDRELGMPSEWYFGLMKEESDWAFVIKLHAVLEAALVHVIDATLDRPTLRRYVERLNVGGQLGKLAFAKALGAIDAKHERFIKALSGIRNDCVHDVRNVNFQFDGYVDGLPQDARQTFLAGFADLLLDPIPFQGKEVPRDDFVRQNTRYFTLGRGAADSRVAIRDEGGPVASKRRSRRLIVGPGMLNASNLKSKKPDETSN